MTDHRSTTQAEQSAIDATYLEHNAMECPSRPLFHGPTVAEPPRDDSRELQNFWIYQLDSVMALTPDDLRNHCLPLARIKKIMKSDEDVRMISAEAPVLFSKACEIFILELTRRAWVQSEANKRRTLQRSDVSAAITAADVFDFLVDIVPREGPERSGMMDQTPIEAETQQHAELYRAAVVSHYPFEGNPTIHRHGMAIEPNIMPSLYQSHFQQCPTTTPTTMLSLNHANNVPDSASAAEYGRSGDGNSRGE